MNVYFGQIYTEVGVSFPFTHDFQKKLSREFTALVEPSVQFSETYGSDYNLIFRISAKKAILDNEIRGPTNFKKAKDVEYTVFLPFDVIMRDSNILYSALSYLFKGVCEVMSGLGIDTAKIIRRQESLIDCICSNPIMFKSRPVQQV